MTVEIRKVFVDTENSKTHKKFRSPRYTVVTDAGDRYSTFDPAVGRLLQEHEGKTVELQLEQNGDYQNVVGLIPSSEPSKTMKPRDPTESRHIARQACLKAAAQVFTGAGTVGETANVLAMADKFMAWVYGEDAVEHIPMPTAEDIAREQFARGMSEARTAPAYPGDVALIGLYNRNPKAAADFIHANPGFPVAIANMSELQKAQLYVFLISLTEPIPA